jgi:CRISPR-associated protein Csa2
MFVSFGFRFRVEVEALNMAEAVGNYARHRLAPIIKIKKDSQGRVIGYDVTMAPAVSGQSIAYGYMKALAELAKKRGLPLCNQCNNYEQYGGFFKRADVLDLSHDKRVESCVVEDITGFLVATKAEGKGQKSKAKKGKKGEEEGGEERGISIKRTSTVMFSYLVPDGVGVIAPQIHVRYNRVDPNQQIPFQIESGTAIYIHGVAIDVDRIGLKEDGMYVADRGKRVELAFEALKHLYSGLLFGAKKSRYLPVFETLGGVAAVSRDLPFMVSPPRLGDYVAETAKRAAAVGGSIKLFCFDKEGITTCGKAEGVTATSTLEELVDAVKSEVVNVLR